MLFCRNNVILNIRITVNIRTWDWIPLLTTKNVSIQFFIAILQSFLKWKYKTFKPDYNTTQDLQGVDDKLISPRRQSTQSFHSPITQLFQTKLYDIHIDAPNFTLATYSTLKEKMWITIWYLKLEDYRVSKTRFRHVDKSTWVVERTFLNSRI